MSVILTVEISVFQMSYLLEAYQTYWYDSASGMAWETSPPSLVEKKVYPSEQAAESRGKELTERNSAIVYTVTGV